MINDDLRDEEALVTTRSGPWPSTTATCSVLTGVGEDWFLAALVVVLFAVVKFTEGAWLIVIIFPVLVYALIRLNREYRKEATILDNPGGDLRRHPPNYSRRVVLLLVDSYDLATIAALRYARSLRPSTLRAVHFSLDGTRADQLRRQWLEAGIGNDGRPAMINPSYELLK